MKKTFKRIWDNIKNEDIESFAFILLFLWTISPVVEYIFKNYCYSLYRTYFEFSIYVIGFLGIISYIVYIIKNKKKMKFKIKNFIPEILLTSLVVIATISSFLSKNYYLSFFGTRYRKEGLIVYIMYIGIMLLVSIIKDSKYLKKLFLSITCSCLIITIFPLFRSDFTYLNFTNVFRNINHYGYYLMINIMIAALMFVGSEKRIKKSAYFIVYAFFLYLLIRNDTFGCYLAIFVSLIAFLIYSLVKKYKRLNVVLLILSFVVISFGVSYYDIKIGERVNFESTKGTIMHNILFLKRDFLNIINSDEEGIKKAGTKRGELWVAAIEYTLNHPIFGGGIENMKEYYYYEKNITYTDRPHNIILQVSSFIGIPGAIIYLTLILYIAIANLKIMGNNDFHIMVYFTAMCYFISSMFGNSMYYTSPYFMILLGILIGFNRYKNKKTRLTK